MIRQSAIACRDEFQKLHIGPMVLPARPMDMEKCRGIFATTQANNREGMAFNSHGRKSVAVKTTIQN